MKNTYVITIVLVVLVIGAVFVFGTGKKVETPVESLPVVKTNMPTDGASNVEEMVAVKEFTVSGKNFSFTPSLITVKKGDSVKITFQNTAGFHDFKIDEFGVATKQAQSPATEVLEFIADKIGSFEYYCSVGSHRMMGMKGTLKVE